MEAGESVRQQVTEVNGAVKQHLTEQEAVVHFDETGLHINGKLNWLHSASTVGMTYYAVHATRERLKQLMLLGILPDYWQAKRCMMAGHRIFITPSRGMPCAMRTIYGN